VRWYENVPIVSWLALRAKCAGCGQPISAVYPTIELMTALGWMATVAVMGPSIEALRVAVFGTVLLGIAATDARHYLIPDGFTLFLLGWQLLLAFVVWFLPGNESSHFAGPYDAIVGACTGAGAIAILRWLGERAFGREAMGEGDITMMAGIGAALGAGRAGLTVLVAAFIGAVVAALVVLPARLVRGRHAVVGHGGASAEVGGGTTEQAGGARDLTEIPFGVFLAPAALVTLLWGDRLIAWYITRILHP
jgi:leader peptidase (prepilin peptidase)/N-methyltransferase